MNDGYGLSSPGSYANYDPGTCLWKTSQVCLFGGLETFLGTWPRSGIMRNGAVYPLPPWVLPISGGASLLLATPTASMKVRSREFAEGRLPNPAEAVMYPTPAFNNNRESNKSASPGAATRLTLLGMAKTGKWPTPKSSPSGPDFARMNRDGSGGDDLATAEARFPTPVSRDCKGKGREGQLGTEIGGQLSPGFVEWLMGFPRFHTEVNHEAEHSEEESTKGVPGPDMLRAVRDHESEAAGAAPRGLHEALGGGDTLPAVSREGGSRTELAPEENGTPVRDLRGSVPAEAQHEQDVLLEVLSLAGCPKRCEEVEGSFSSEELRELRSIIRATKGQGNDLLKILWEQARVEDTQNPWSNGEWPEQPRVEQGVRDRVDRLRALGNAVVPQVAEWLGRRFLDVP